MPWGEAESSEVSQLEEILAILLSCCGQFSVVPRIMARFFGGRGVILVQLTSSPGVGKSCGF